MYFLQIIWVSFCLLLPSFLVSQTSIDLQNPSFEEGEAGPGNTPSGWVDFGFPFESPVDIQSNNDKWFNVSGFSLKGTQFVGMVTRSNNTWEAIGQRLSRPLKKNNYYQFSLWARKSPEFDSQDRVTGEAAKYTSPTKLRIWGYDKSKKKAAFLAESGEIEKEKWEEVRFGLRPLSFDIDWLVIEVYYLDNRTPTNGHALIDACSQIELVKKEDAETDKIFVNNLSKTLDFTASLEELKTLMKVQKTAQANWTRNFVEATFPEQKKNIKIELAKQEATRKKEDDLKKAQAKENKKSRREIEMESDLEIREEIRLDEKVQPVAPAKSPAEKKKPSKKN